MNTAPIAVPIGYCEQPHRHCDCAYCRGEKPQPKPPDKKAQAAELLDRALDEACQLQTIIVELRQIFASL